MEPKTTEPSGPRVRAMHVRRVFYDQVAAGEKTLEIRVAYPRLRDLAPGQRIRFLCDDDPARAVIAQAYASLHCLWVGYSLPAQYSAGAQAGLIAPGGRWLARYPALAVADIDLNSTDPDIDIARRLARHWRRIATPSLYEPRTRSSDPRSSHRACL